MNLKAIEGLELKYLNKFFAFLEFSLDEIQAGLKTRDKIFNDWEGLYGTKLVTIQLVQKELFTLF